VPGASPVSATPQRRPARCWDRFTDQRAEVPSLWHVEVANDLVVSERHRRITPARTNEFIALTGTLPIVVDETDARPRSDYRTQLGADQSIERLRCELSGACDAPRCAACDQGRCASKSGPTDGRDFAADRVSAERDNPLVAAVVAAQLRRCCASVLLLRGDLPVVRTDLGGHGSGSRCGRGDFGDDFVDMTTAVADHKHNSITPVEPTGTGAFKFITMLPVQSGLTV
jgi:hypothetical protein